MLMKPERAPKKLTEIEPVVFTDPYSKVFKCPCCNARLQFKVQVNVLGVYELDQDDQPVVVRPAPVPKDSLTTDERDLVESIKKEGLFDAFERTIRTSTPHNVPSDLEKYFLTFLKRATKIKTPQFAIRPCLPVDEREGELELYAFQNIAAVVNDGFVRSFLPYQLVNGKEIADTLQPSGNGVSVTRRDLTLSDWVKTRNGYVAGRGLLFNELRGRAKGSFANTGI